MSKNDIKHPKCSFKLYFVLPMLLTAALLTGGPRDWVRVMGQSRGPSTSMANLTKSVLYNESHALIIGVSSYSRGWPELRGVMDDVREVKSALEKNGFRTRLALNATRQGFDEAMRCFIAQCGQNKENRLVIYFAGHGATLISNDGLERRTGYLVPSDAPLSTTDGVGEFKRFAISIDDLESAAKQITAKHVLFVLDSCFSGIIFSKRGVPDSIRDKVDQPVRQFITSGTDRQAVPDESIFRKQFVAGLVGEADSNCDGYVTGSELGEFLHSTVTDYTRRRQTPQHGKINDADLDKGDIVFFVPAERGRCSSLSAEDQGAWNAIENSTDSTLYREYLAKYPNGSHNNAALSRIQELEINSPKSPEATGSAQLRGMWGLAEDQTIMVQANAQWTSTLIKVESGQQIKIDASYTQVNLGANGYGGPEGVASPDSRRPLRDCPTGALIARIGSQSICIRSAAEFKVEAAGELMLGLNESRTGDNRGALPVRVRVYRLTR